MASVVIEIIASAAEAAAVAGEVAGEAAVIAEEASIATEISGTAGIVAESIESVAGVEIEGVVAEVEGAEISELVSEEVEDIASEEIEEDVESTVDDAISDIEGGGSEGSGSITGTAKLIAKTILRWTKRLVEAYMIVDIVGRFIESLLHPSKSSQKPLTPDQKATLSRLLDAVSLLKEITSSWQQAFKPLENLDLGKVTATVKDNKEESAYVTDIVDGLLSSTVQHLKKLKPLTSKISSGWNDNINKSLEDGLYQTVLPLDAICQLKTTGMAKQLQLFKFPSDDDCESIKGILNKDFDMETKKKAMEDIQKCITDQVREKAKTAGVNAAMVIMKPNVESKVKSAVNSNYVPEATSRAKDAAKSAAKHVANSYKGKMIGYAFIPIYGMIKVNQLKKEMKAKAKAAAEVAAKQAAEEYMRSADVTNGIKDQTREAVKSVFAERYSQITAHVKQACSEVIKKALANRQA